MTEENKDAISEENTDDQFTEDAPVVDDEQISDDDLVEGGAQDTEDTPEVDQAEEPADQADADAPQQDDQPETPAQEDELVQAEQELEDDEPVDVSPDSARESEDGFETTVEAVVEAILFASDEPLGPSKIVNIVEAGSINQIKNCIASLNDKYEQTGSTFRIERIAGGYQMMTLGAYNHWIKKLVRVRTDNKLSPAALEALAIISYKQPIIRADVEAIRGVASGEVIRNLMYKGLVKIAGRAEVLGRPMLYGTTKKFLDTFGLGSLKDLPKIEELKRPSQ